MYDKKLARMMRPVRMVRQLRIAQRKSCHYLFVRDRSLLGEQTYDCEVSHARYLLRDLVSRFGAADTARLLTLHH